MSRSPLTLLLVLVSTAVFAPVFGQDDSNPREVARAIDLSAERALVEASVAARATSDASTARARAAEAVERLCARDRAERGVEWSALLHAAGQAAFEAKDLATAAAAWERTLAEREARLHGDDLELQTTRHDLARVRFLAGDSVTARDLMRKVVEVRTRLLAEDHPDLLAARNSLAVSLRATGDFAGSRDLHRLVLASRLRTLPEDHLLVQVSRENLAVTLDQLGETGEAVRLQEFALDVRLRVQPEDHPEVSRAKGNLAAYLDRSGDLRGARTLKEQVLETALRTLPEDHEDVQRARASLGSTLQELGETGRALELQDQALAVAERTLPFDHPTRQLLRSLLSATLTIVGQLDRARDLYEEILEVDTLRFGPGHPDTLRARQNLAATLLETGDPLRARALIEGTVEAFERILTDDHPDLQSYRQNLGAVLWVLGDAAGAEQQFGKVLEVLSRTLPDDHVELQKARMNYGSTCSDPDTAVPLLRKAIEVYERTLPGDHPETQKARQNLGSILRSTGDAQAGSELYARVLDAYSRTLPQEHPLLQAARFNAAACLSDLGDHAGALRLHETILEVRARTLPDDHPDLQGSRRNVILQTVKQWVLRGGSGPKERQRCFDLLESLGRAQTRAALATIRSGSSREAEERCARLAEAVHVLLSFAQDPGGVPGWPGLASTAFTLSETTRAAGLAAAERAHRTRGSAEHAAARAALLAASEDLARLVRQATSGPEFDRAHARREAAERKLGRLAEQSTPGADETAAADAERIARHLAPGAAAVGLRRYSRVSYARIASADGSGRAEVREVLVSSLAAFVVRGARDDAEALATPGPGLTLVDLGPVQRIEEAVSAWRASLGVARDSRGIAAGVVGGDPVASDRAGKLVRQLVFDPLLSALGGAEHVVIALDDALHLVPIDALPLEDGSLVGDRWRIETRTTLTEVTHPRAGSAGAGRLVAVGDVDYGEAVPVPAPEPNGQLAAAPEGAAGSGVELTDPAATRGASSAREFAPLPATGVEVRGVADRFRERFGTDAQADVLVGPGASRERLLALAPGARWLHVATHGWFAPDSIRSSADADPVDAMLGLGVPSTSAQQVRRMSPLLLCGLALAGANLPEDAFARRDGLLTADEISTLDLSECHLVVLSACDTNTGVRRAGQGVASMQKALQMAGARSVVTSLWKVPDGATAQLMLEFYRRQWVDGQPKWRALWEAKRALREARDVDGEPLYSPRDWAAWVLTGEPD